MATFPRKRTRYCEHCSQHVSHRVYKRHKDQYYDFNNQTWIKRKTTETSDQLNKDLDDVDGSISSDTMFSDVVDSRSVTDSVANFRSQYYPTSCRDRLLD